MPPAVSVVITAYNQRSFLPHALDSVRAQTFKDYEILIVDDASTDETPAYLAQQPNVRVLRNPTNRGVCASRNLGWQMASGRYVSFLDGDDLFLPDKLAAQVASMDADPMLGLVYADSQFCDVSEADLPWRFSDLYPPHRGPDIFEALVRANFIAMSATLIRRVCLDRIGGFDDTMPTEDWHLWLRLSAVYPAHYLPQVLAKYRVHGANISRRRLKDTRGNAMVRRWLITSSLFARLGPETQYRCYLSAGISLAKLGQMTEARQMWATARHMYPWRPITYGLALLTFLGETRFRSVIDRLRLTLEWVRGTPQPFGPQGS